MSPVLYLLLADRLDGALAMEGVVRLYHELLVRFRDYRVWATGNAAEDLYGFQAANLQATFQLVRMTLSPVDTNHNVHQKCAIAEELLASLRSICPRFVISISTPLVYQLGGIGHILATVTEGSLTEDSYQRVRSSLVSMTDLLEDLESGLQPTAGASKSLRAQVEKVDQYRQSQRSYGPHTPNPNSMAVSYSQGQLHVSQKQQPSMEHAVIDGYLALPAGDQSQVLQEVVDMWQWPFNYKNPSHPMNSVQGFSG
jgi:hypothetical protein